MDPNTQQPETDDPGLITLAEGITVAEVCLTWTAARSSGPGGQSVNKVNTKMQLAVSVDDIQGFTDPQRLRLRTLAGKRLTNDDRILIAAQNHRSQIANRRACLERLMELAEEARNVPVPRKARRITRGMKQRRLNAKKEQSDKKQRRNWRGDDA